MLFARFLDRAGNHPLNRFVFAAVSLLYTINRAVCGLFQKVQRIVQRTAILFRKAAGGDERSVQQIALFGHGDADPDLSAP